jgi:hypothetical protein
MCWVNRGINIMGTLRSSFFIHFLDKQIEMIQISVVKFIKWLFLYLTRKTRRRKKCVGMQMKCVKKITRKHFFTWIGILTLVSFDQPLSFCVLCASPVNHTTIDRRAKRTKNRMMNVFIRKGKSTYGYKDVYLCVLLH